MTITDLNYSTSEQQAPASDALAITPSDITVLPTRTRALYIGGTGDLVVKMVDGTIITFVGVVVGSVLPIRVTQVRAATTATSIVALF